jgi:hypothetical protein
MSGWEFKYPTKRGAHWVELETDMTDKITPDALERLITESMAEAEQHLRSKVACHLLGRPVTVGDFLDRIAALAARLAEAEAALQSIVKFVEIADDPTHHTLGLVGNIAGMALGEEARAQKQADEHRARGGYVGGV